MNETKQTADDRAHRRFAELELVAEYIAEIALEKVEPEIAAFVCRKAGQVCGDATDRRRRPCADGSRRTGF